MLGQYTWNGDSPLLSKGVCYSLKENPTISDSVLEIKEDVSDFKTTITGLTKNTNYYIRIFAKNIVGITYSEQVNIKTANILPTAPILTSIDADSITTTSAKLGGNISSDGGEPVIERGIILSTVQIPSNKDSIVTCGIGTGSFSKTFNKLQPNILYYYRAYAKNTVGISYGSVKTFKTELPTSGFGPILTDIDGNKYKTVYINKQLWMAENLKVTKYSNGTSISNVVDASLWSSDTKGAWCNYNNQSSYDTKYGKLYNGIVINMSMNGNKNVCPTGWHVPKKQDWNDLITNVGGSYNGGTLKEVGYTEWNSPNTGATNSTLYSALPSGYRGKAGDFQYQGRYLYYWAYDPNTPSSYNSLDLSYNHTYIGISVNMGKNEGAAIRCLKN